MPTIIYAIRKYDNRTTFSSTNSPIMVNVLNLGQCKVILLWLVEVSRSEQVRLLNRSVKNHDELMSDIFFLVVAFELSWSLEVIFEG